MSPISRLGETGSQLAETTRLVTVTREQLLERLAEVDALLDILAEHDETELMIERDRIAWLLEDD